MVAEPSYQNQNLGTKILSTFIQIAKNQGAIAITVNGRLTAVGFQQKLEFQACGIELPLATRVTPIEMHRKLC